jgi:hypothetical protein
MGAVPQDNLFVAKADGDPVQIKTIEQLIREVG